MDDTGPKTETALALIARTGAQIAVDCAMALAEQGLLTKERSEGIEAYVRELADAYRLAGGQAAETTYLRLAETLRQRRGLAEQSS